MSQLKLTEIDKLINRSLRCIHFKGWNESVNSIKIEKKISDVENKFKYEFWLSLGDHAFLNIKTFS